jgi:hypothetical protein
MSSAFTGNVVASPAIRDYPAREETAYTDSVQRPDERVLASPDPTTRTFMSRIEQCLERFHQCPREADTIVLLHDIFIGPLSP